MIKSITDELTLEQIKYNEFVYRYQPKCWCGPIYDFVSFYRVSNEEFQIIKETKSIEKIEGYKNAFYYKEAMEEFFKNEQN